MATRKMICLLSHERGEKFSVGDPPKTYDIPADGVVEVDEAHADLMAQNHSKWSPFTGEPPPRIGGKRPALPMLEDQNGNQLSDEETQKLVDANNKKAEEEAAAKKKAEDDKAAADKAAADAEAEKNKTGNDEPPPANWPVVSMDDKKDDLLAVAQRLADAGHVEPGSFSSKTNKEDLLEIIEQGYDKL